MGFIRSVKKTITMNKITKMMLDPMAAFRRDGVRGMMSADVELEALFNSLYSIMLDMPGYKDILLRHNTNGNELKLIANRVACAGFDFQGGDFLPVALLSFGQPLDVMLSHRDEILNHSYTEVAKVVDMAKKML